MANISEQRLKLSFNNVARDMGFAFKRLEDLEAENTQLKKHFEILMDDLESVSASLKLASQKKASASASQAREEKRFVYNKTSNKAHLEGCVFAMKIKPDHRILFDTKEEFVSMNPSFCACVEA